MARPYRTPFYPVFPLIALAGAVVALGAMTWFNPLIALIYAGVLAAGYAHYHWRGRHLS